jgi:hypothetical protein
MRPFPPEYDERLWFTLRERCQGRHYVLGSPLGVFHGVWPSVAEFLRAGVWVDDRQRPQTLSEDTELAQHRGITFQVMERAGRHEPWIAVSDAIGDPETALSVAVTRPAWRVGVFTSDGYLYWTSDSPETRNSTVLHDPGTPGNGAA